MSRVFSWRGFAAVGALIVLTVAFWRPQSVDSPRVVDKSLRDDYSSPSSVGSTGSWSDQNGLRSAEDTSSPTTATATKERSRTMAPTAVPTVGDKTEKPTQQPPSADIFALPENNASKSTSSANKFYIIEVPEYTEWLVGNFTAKSAFFYEDGLNENAGEMWIHKGLMQHHDRTMDPEEADVFVICGYLVLNHGLRTLGVTPTSEGLPRSNHDFGELVVQRIVNRTKPHVLAVLATNSVEGRENVRLQQIVNALKDNVDDLYSFGYERNSGWQGGLPPDRIIPVPYVVNPAPREELLTAMETNRTENFVFYAGDLRPHAQEWAGCDRGMVKPLENRPDMDVRVIGKKNRLSQEEYNHRMLTSDYCLIICGDTPTSRSLASSMVAGCIPLRIGSRLRGLCEPPCKKGWGWTIANLPHLPFWETINWEDFPEVDELDFSEYPLETLDSLFDRIDYKKKESLRAVMKRVQLGFVYGWGNPVEPVEFGDAVAYIWRSLQARLDGVFQ